MIPTNITHLIHYYCPIKGAVQYLLDNGTYSAEIIVNDEYVGRSSKEGAVAIVIHEFVHAYLRYNGDSSLTTAQHEEISKKYVTPMAEYLHDTYNTPLKDAYAVAWSSTPLCN